MGYTPRFLSCIAEVTAGEFVVCSPLAYLYSESDSERPDNGGRTWKGEIVRVFNLLVLHAPRQPPPTHARLFILLISG